jgi:hypothetical protein
MNNPRIAEVSFDKNHLIPFTYPHKDSDLFTVFFQVLPKEKRVNMLAVSHFRVFVISKRAIIEDENMGKPFALAIDSKAFVEAVKVHKGKGHVQISIFPDGALFEFSGFITSHVYINADSRAYMPDISLSMEPFIGEPAAYNPRYVAEAGKAWIQWGFDKRAPLFMPNGDSMGGFVSAWGDDYYAALVMPVLTGDMDMNEYLLTMRKHLDTHQDDELAQSA